MNNFNAITSIKKPASKPSSRLRAYLLLLAIGLLNIGLIKWSSFYKDHFFETQLSVWILLLAGLSSLNLAKYIEQLVLSALLIAQLSALGLLLGGIYEFGREGLTILVQLCSQKITMGIGDTLARMLQVAPASHVGMSLGCVLAALFVQRVRGISFSKSTVFISHTLCLLGMFAGMWLSLWLIGTLQSEAYLVLNASPNYLPLLIMWVGMSAGTYIAMLCCKTS